GHPAPEGPRHGGAVGVYAFPVAAWSDLPLPTASDGAGHALDAASLADARLGEGVTLARGRPGMSGDSSSWKGWGHVRWFIEEVPAGAA
ncbi:hypothetical protein ACNJUL_21225, partial [Mycobacterium tuberculosis]